MVKLQASSEDTRVYELCVLYPYPLSQKEESELIKSIEALCEEHGGKLIDKDMWGRRGLAYAIEGYDEGSYVVYYYEFKPEAIKELDNNLRILSGVLRHMLIKPPKDYEIVKYSEEYEKWIKGQADREEMQKKNQEEELKKKMLKKQQIKAKRDAAKRKDTQEKTEKSDKEIGSEIDKLISDDDLDI